MNTGSARTAPLSSSATASRSTTDKPQPTQSSPQAGQANNDENMQEYTGSESRGHSKIHNGDNYYGTDRPKAGRQTFSKTQSFDYSMTHNGNNIGLKVPNDHGQPPPQQSFQPPSQPPSQP